MTSVEGNKAAKGKGKAVLEADPSQVIALALLPHCLYSLLHMRCSMKPQQQQFTRLLTAQRISALTLRKLTDPQQQPCDELNNVADTNALNAELRRAYAHAYGPLVQYHL